MRSSVALGPLQLRYSPFTAQMPDFAGLVRLLLSGRAIAPRGLLAPICASHHAGMPERFSSIADPRESTSRPFFPISKFRRSCGAVSGAHAQTGDQIPVTGL